MLWAVLSFTTVGLILDLIVRLNDWSVQVFPGPLTVFKSLFELLFNGTLIQHSVASLYRVTVGFLSGRRPGHSNGYRNRSDTHHTLDTESADSILYGPISPLAWIPLAMLWFGIGDQPAIFLIFLSSFFSLLVATSIAVTQINPIYFQVAANFGFSRSEVVWKIVVPAITAAGVDSIAIDHSHCLAGGGCR